MKKLRVSLVVAILVLSSIFTGCGQKGGDASNNVDNSAKKKFPGAVFLPEKGATIRVASPAGDRESGYADQLAKKFEEMYKEYDVKVEIVPDDGFQLEIDGPAGKAPDVFIVSNDKGNWYAGHLIMPIDPAIKAMDNNDIPKWGWDSFKYNDTYYGYPMTIQTTMLMYRKSLVPKEWKNENGELAVKSWNDLYAFNRGVKDGIYKDTSATHGIIYEVSNVYNSYGLLESYGSYLFKDGTDTFDLGFNIGDSYKGAKVMRDIAETMYDTHVTWETTNQIPGEMARGNFIGTLNTPNQIRNIVNQLVTQEVYSTEEEAYEDLGYMPLPVLPADGDIKTPLQEGEVTIPTKSMGGTTGGLISSFTQYPNASRLYIIFAAQTENVIEKGIATSLTPIRNSAYEGMTQGTKAMFEQTLDNKFIGMPTIPEMGQVWGPAQSVFNKFVDDHHDDSINFDLDDDIKAELEKLSKDIKDAITALE
jgi:arabinogalactan oligomer/maltooligosaccharide transport system substrate-binding protein